MPDMFKINVKVDCFRIAWRSRDLLFLDQLLSYIADSPVSILFSGFRGRLPEFYFMVLFLFWFWIIRDFDNSFPVDDLVYKLAETTLNHPTRYRYPTVCCSASRARPTG